MGENTILWTKEMFEEKIFDCCLVWINTSVANSESIAKLVVFTSSLNGVVLFTNAQCNTIIQMLVKCWKTQQMSNNNNAGQWVFHSARIMDLFESNLKLVTLDMLASRECNLTLLTSHCDPDYVLNNYPRVCSLWSHLLSLAGNPACHTLVLKSFIETLIKQVLTNVVSERLSESKRFQFERFMNECHRIIVERGLTCRDEWHRFLHTNIKPCASKKKVQDILSFLLSALVKG